MFCLSEYTFPVHHSASVSGAVYVDAARSVSIAGMRLEDNTARQGSGGGLYVANAERMEVTSSFFASNSATFGGAIATFSSGSPSGRLVYSACTFTENTAERDGGAIYSVASSDELRNIVMDGNFAGPLILQSRV